MASPFEESDANDTPLRNDEHQHPLRPAFAPTPGGRTVVPGPGRREECVANVRERRVDLCPGTVAAHAEAS